MAKRKKAVAEATEATELVIHGLKATPSMPSPGRRTEIVKPDDVPTFYVNSVNFEMTNWDVKMRLGQIHSGDESVIRVTESVRIFMSHNHTRAFAAALNGLIE